MQRIMLRRAVYSALFAGLTAGLTACGGGGSGGGSSSIDSSSAPATSKLQLTMSDASSDDWACVAVKVLSIALVPASGGTPVTVWSAPTPAPYVNLEQLDQLNELLGAVSVPQGSYSGAVLTISANPGDVLLTTAANPASGFPLAAATQVPADQIQIQGATGAAGSQTVTVDLSFANPLTLTSAGNQALDIEFNLDHPAFIVGHTPPAADGATIWAVNFHGPVRRLGVPDITRLVLRHTYGTVSGVSAGSLTLYKDFPVMPATNPESAIESAEQLSIDCDGVNGTIVYDLDAGTRTVVNNFGSESALNGKYVRIAARFQQDGSLVAVRVWASSDFTKVWLSPEGHVLNVNTASAVITVTNEDGIGVPVSINAATEFFFRTPQNAQADATPIGTGTTFLANQDLVRGFKVHVSAVDPLAVPLTAQTIDIETANFGGDISNASASGFTYSSQYLIQSDNYSLTLPYIAATAANGADDEGDAIMGFKWWYFTFPTLVNFGSSAIPNFISTTAGAVNFGGSVGTLTAWGASRAIWGDGTDDSSSGWYLREAVLEPTPVPLATVDTGYADNLFTMTVAGGSQPVTVNVNTTAGSATLVYQIDRSNGIVTITPVDLTTASGLAALNAGVTAGAIVKVYGVPNAPVAPATSGTLQAYVLAFYTGTMPSM
jgi:Domain of unknown function (DUF4382)